MHADVHGRCAYCITVAVISQTQGVLNIAPSLIVITTITQQQAQPMVSIIPQAQFCFLTQSHSPIKTTYAIIKPAFPLLSHRHIQQRMHHGRGVSPGRIGLVRQTIIPGCHIAIRLKHHQPSNLRIRVALQPKVSVIDYLFGCLAIKCNCTLYIIHVPANAPDIVIRPGKQTVNTLSGHVANKPTYSSRHPMAKFRHAGILANRQSL